jgi:hypothetical protein
MATLRKIYAGHTARAWGKKFEQMIELCASRDGITMIRIPDGCETRRGPHGKPIIRRVRSPFDFVALKNGSAIIFDAKTVDGNTFSRSAITPHQMESLSRCAVDAQQSGYLVWYRFHDTVAFHPVEQLVAMKRGQSLQPTKGQILGVGGAFSFAALFQYRLDLDADTNCPDQ